MKANFSLRGVTVNFSLRGVIVNIFSLLTKLTVETDFLLKTCLIKLSANYNNYLQQLFKNLLQMTLTEILLKEDIFSND